MSSKTKSKVMYVLHDKNRQLYPSTLSDSPSETWQRGRDIVGAAEGRAWADAMADKPYNKARMGLAQRGWSIRQVAIGSPEWKKLMLQPGPAGQPQLDSVGKALYDLLTAANSPTQPVQPVFRSSTAALKATRSYRVTPAMPNGVEVGNVYLWHNVEVTVKVVNPTITIVESANGSQFNVPTQLLGTTYPLVRTHVAAQLAIDNAELRRRINALEANLAVQRTTIASFQSQNGQLQSQVYQLQTQLNLANTQLNQLNQAIGGVRRQMGRQTPW